MKQFITIMKKLIMTSGIRIFFSIVAFALVVIPRATEAQAYPLSISIQVLPPYSTKLAHYFNEPGHVILMITNNSANGESYKIFLAGMISTLDGETYIEVGHDHAPDPPALEIGPGTTMLSASDLEEFMDAGSVNYGGVKQEQIQNGNLPEGDYQICLVAYDFETLEQLSSDSKIGCSNVFPVRFLDPPVILTPSENANLPVAKGAPQFVFFSWQNYATGIPAGNLRYDFKLVWVPENFDATSIMDGSNDPQYVIKEEESLSTTFLNYDISYPNLILGNTYAVRITAKDINGDYLFNNGGKSEVRTFTYGTPPGSFALTAVYPANETWIPFNFFPIIVKYDPYNPDYNQWHSNINITSNAGSDTWKRDLGWEPDPLTAQKKATGISDMTVDQAQHIAVYKRDNDNPSPLSFNRCSHYTYTVDVEIDGGKFPKMNSTVGSGFYYGMSASTLLSPGDKAAVPKGAVTLTFRTADRPAKIIPPFPIVQGNHGVASYIYGIIDERWKLEISRTPNFKVILDTATGRVGYDKNLLQHADENTIMADLYKEVSKTFQITDTGFYYWRVKWLKNPANPGSSEYYNISPVQQFKVDTVPPATPTATARHCGADCTSALPENRVAVAGIAHQGDSVRVGNFKMKVTSISWSGSTASGEGTIHVPYLNAPMRVKFNGISMNSAKEVYEGNCYGLYDTTTLFPEEMPAGVQGLTGLTPEQYEAINTYASQGARFVSQLGGSVPMGLPIGLDNTGEDGNRYTIAIVGLKFTPTMATLNAMIALDIPQCNGFLGLGATNICFNPGGLSLSQVLLYLPMDQEIPFTDSLTLKFKKTEFEDDNITIKGDTGTYVSMNCDGFQSLRIKADMVFGRNLLVPEDVAATGLAGPGNVIASFKTTIRKKGDWSASLTFNKPFQVVGAEGWGFQVTNATLDFSSSTNPDGIKYPPEYKGDKGNTWEGFYLKDITLSLPPQFKVTESSGRVSASIHDLLIDRSGLSGSFRIENVFTIEGGGNLSGWGFSMDTLNIDIASSSFTRGGFAGGIQIPVSDKPLHYSSYLTMSHQKLAYEFIIKTTDTINASLWAAKLALFPSSSITLTASASDFDVVACLNGLINIDGRLGEIPVKMTLMEFQNFKLMTKEPYIDCNFVPASFASSQHETAGFPVSITNLKFETWDGPKSYESNRTEGPRAGLTFALTVNVTGESNTFSATVGLNIAGKMNTGGGSQAMWQYSGIGLDSIRVYGSTDYVTIDGRLKFYERNEIYGTGFKGSIEATLAKTINVRVAAQFGTLQKDADTLRYFYMDALAIIQAGIPIATGISLYGFGGGVWYHMIQNNLIAQLPQNAPENTGQPVGGSPSEAVYLPTDTIMFGFKATVVIGTVGGGDAVNADVTFGMNINDHGGVNDVYFEGKLYVMCAVTQRQTAKVHALVLLDYNFTNNVLEGGFDVYLNVEGYIKGTLDNEGRVGSGYLHADKNKWYLKVGRPSRFENGRWTDDHRLSAEIVKLFTVQAYMQVGTDIDPAPPIPDMVLDGLKNIPGFNATSFNARSSQLVNGKGFAFGASASLGIPRTELCCGFYGIMQLQLGFDFSLLYYGTTVFCENNPPGQAFGINGWYAMGDFYAYLNGEFGYNKFPIVGITMAFVIKGGAPNPNWYDAHFYARVKFAGKDLCEIPVSLRAGDPCTIVTENPVSSLAILDDLTPEEGATEVDLGAKAYATFIPEMNTDIQVVQTMGDGTNMIRTIHYIIDYFAILKGQESISGHWSVAADHKMANFNPNKSLKRGTDYLVKIRVHPEEYLNGAWAPAKKNDGTLIYETLEHHFRTTENYPAVITENDVASSYPVNLQRYYLQDECPTGFVKFNQTYNELFSEPPAAGYDKREHFARFIPIDGGQTVESKAVYNDAYYMVAFNMPRLQNSTTYAVQIISRDIRETTISFIIPPVLPGESGGQGGGDNSQGQPDNPGFPNYQGNYGQSNFGGQGNNYTPMSHGNQQIDHHTGGMTYQRRNGTDVEPNEKLMYRFYFRTSQFNTLSEKIAGFANQNTVSGGPVNQPVLFASFTSTEYFDRIDADQLINIFFNWKSLWHTNFAEPYIYGLLKEYTTARPPYSTMTLLRDDPDFPGIPPYKAVFQRDDSWIAPALDENEYLAQGGTGNPVYSNAPGQMTVIGIGSGFWVYQDWQRLGAITAQVISVVGIPEVSELIIEPLKTHMINFLRDPFQPYTHGQYALGFSYNLPEACAGGVDVGDKGVYNISLPFTY